MTRTLKPVSLDKGTVTNVKVVLEGKQFKESFYHEGVTMYLWDDYNFIVTVSGAKFMYPKGRIFRVKVEEVSTQD